MAAGSNMVTTIIGFGMSVVFTIFVCMRLLCGRFRRARSRPNFEFDAPMDVVEQPHHEFNFNGLETVLVAEIPTTKFSRDTFSVDDAQCWICLAEYEEKETLRIMPKCGHIFHLACIDIWLRKQSSCPVCRLPLKDSFKGKIDASPHRLLLLPTNLEHYSEGSSTAEATNPP